MDGVLPRENDKHAYYVVFCLCDHTNLTQAVKSEQQCADCLFRVTSWRWSTPRSCQMTVPP